MTAKTPKPLPTIAQDLPPIKPSDYAYFSPPDQRAAFEATLPGAFSWTNAWWLADFSLLSYCNEVDIKAGLSTSGFRMRDGHFFSVAPSQAFVASDENAIVVAFRGTEVPDFRSHGAHDFASTARESAGDWLTDARIARVPFADSAGRPCGAVHRGFRDAFALLQRQVGDTVAALRAEKPRPVWYTGHSLGGALATLGAAFFGDAAGLYTYGCPRVGTDAFVQAFPGNAIAWRLCIPGDPVVLVPPGNSWPVRIWKGAGYSHLGPAIWIDEHGGAVRSGDGNAPLAVPNPRRHAPMRYSSLIWNRLALGKAG